MFVQKCYKWMLLENKDHNFHTKVRLFPYIISPDAPQMLKLNMATNGLRLSDHS